MSLTAFVKQSQTDLRYARALKIINAKRKAGQTGSSVSVLSRYSHIRRGSTVRDLTSPAEIDAVLDGNDSDELVELIANPRLNDHQALRLIAELETWASNYSISGSDYARALINTQPLITDTLLRDLATTHNDYLMIRNIGGHPNASDETKTLCALRLPTLTSPYA